MKTKMHKVRHDKNFRLEHEGHVWQLDIAEWRDDRGGGQLRVYTVHGDINANVALWEALELEATTRGLEAVLSPVQVGRTGSLRYR